MIFYCQGCCEPQQQAPTSASVALSRCKCGSTSFATWKPTPPALPDEAGEMVRRLREMERRYGDRLYGDAAALIERLAPGWISVDGYAGARARFAGEGIHAEPHVTFVYRTDGNVLVALPLPPQKGST